MPAKLDPQKALASLHAPFATDLSVLNVPEMQLLMLDGQDDPRRTKPERLKTVPRQPRRRA